MCWLRARLRRPGKNILSAVGRREIFGPERKHPVAYHGKAWTFALQDRGLRVDPPDNRKWQLSYLPALRQLRLSCQDQHKPARVRWTGKTCKRFDCRLLRRSTPDPHSDSPVAPSQ